MFSRTKVEGCRCCINISTQDTGYILLARKTYHQTFAYDMQHCKTKTVLLLHAVASPLSRHTSTRLSSSIVAVLDGTEAAVLSRHYKGGNAARHRCSCTARLASRRI